MLTFHEFSLETFGNFRLTSYRYFSIGTDSGILSVRTLLSLDTSDREYFEFRVIARDSGNPQPRSTTANVHINIHRGGLSNRGIGFDSDRYMWEVTENDPIAQGRRSINSIKILLKY